MNRHLATLAIAAFLLAAATTPAPAQRQIRVAIIDANFKNGCEVVAREYEKLHPGVEVKIQILPGDNYVTWIRAAIAGGEQTAPDIFNINMTTGYFEAGKAISLKPYLEGISPYTGKPWIDSFHKEYIEMARVAGDYPQVPLGFIDIGFFYNKSLFKKAGVEPPATWNEMLDVCQKLQDAGIIPIGIGGNLDSYWQGTVGWVVRVLCDAYYFDKVPFAMAHPGDFIYAPDIDGVYKTDPADPYCDLLVNLSNERILQAILDGNLRFDDDRTREIYIRLRDLARYWQPGYNGADAAAAGRLFFTQECAMILGASPSVMDIEINMKDLAPEKRFEVGIFRIPSITDSEYVQVKTRGAGGAMPVYGIVRKTKEQQDLAADFLMYLLRDASCETLVVEALKANQPLIGPFAIKGVDLPAGMDEKYKPFFGLGREKLEFRGLRDEQESVWRWSSLAQDYMADRMSIDAFVEQYQLIMVQAIPRVIRMQKLDMDPRTRDNNEGLFVELKALFDPMKKDRSAVPASRAAFVDRLAAQLKELARATARTAPDSPDSPTPAFDLIEERTIPFLIVEDEKEFEKRNADARAIASSAGYQYLAVILNSPQRFDYAFHDFRPEYRSVVEGLEGKRYTREQLKKILMLD